MFLLLIVSTISLVNKVVSKQTEEFIGLRAKLHSYKMFEGKENKKCKGVKNVVKNSITHEMMKTTNIVCLQDANTLEARLL